MLDGTQALANKYARLRDCAGGGGANCISCGRWFSYEELDGGHFIPTTVSSTRFDERNINAQCHRCNRFLHGNIRQYFRGLEAKLGRDALDDLETMAASPLKKWTKDECDAIKAYYKLKIADCLAGKFPESTETMTSMFDQPTPVT